jgi:hypothetical protein
MKSTLDLVDIVWTALDASALKAAITGDISKHRRTPNSTKEDIVINALPISGAQIQEAIVNVNLHVPDIKVNKNGMDDFMPNHTRLKALCNIALNALQDNWGEDYNFDVQQQNLFRDEEANDHYINIRLEFYNVNILN